MVRLYVLKSDANVVLNESVMMFVHDAKIRCQPWWLGRRKETGEQIAEEHEK